MTVITANPNRLRDLIRRYLWMLARTGRCCQHPGEAVLRVEQEGGSLRACCRVCGAEWREYVL